VRLGPVTDREPAPGPPRLPTLIRAGCAALFVLGVLTILLATGSVISPGGVQCQLSRAFIDQANRDSKKYNDVELGGREVAKLPCPEAVALASRIPRNEKGTKTLSIPTESALRVRGVTTIIVGFGQAAGAVMTYRTLDRRARTVALGFAALGVLFPIVGVFSTAISVFAVYALGFSAPSREIWPRPAGGGLGLGGGPR
jgi:hypothetical protein